MLDWEQIVREHSGVVWRTAFRLLGNEADASDCFQAVFADAIATLDTGKAAAVINWEALLCRMATFRALDLLRRRYRRRAREQPIDEAPQAAGESASQQAEYAELRDRLRAALAELPKEQAAAFHAFELEALNYEQTAERLQTTVSNVGVLLHRARARLRTLLSDLQPTLEHEER